MNFLYEIKEWSDKLADISSDISSDISCPSDPTCKVWKSKPLKDWPQNSCNYGDITTICGALNLVGLLVQEIKLGQL